MFWNLLLPSLKCNLNIEATGSSETSVFARIDYAYVFFFLYPLVALSGVGLYWPDRERFPVLRQPRCLLQDLSRFHQLPHTLFLFYPWPSFTATLQLLFPIVCLGFFVLSILIRCSNHLSSLLAAFLVARSWFSIPPIWLFLIQSLLLFPMHFRKCLISAPTIMLSCFVHIVQLPWVIKQRRDVNRFRSPYFNLQVFHPRCVLCKWGWVGPSKHNCRRIVFYWLDDDDMFRQCLAILRS